MSPNTRAGNSSNVGEVIDEAMKRHRVPGLSAAVIQDGVVTGSHSRGLMNVDKGEPISADTVFEAASLTKPVYAYMALGLHEQGVLGLDEPLGRYLREPYIDDERVGRITMRDVLRHTPGFPNWRPKGGELQLKYEPGSRFSYSGEGYKYLQTVVEVVTGLPSEQLVRTRVLKPLGMARSQLVWHDDLADYFADPHASDGSLRSRRAYHEANAAYTLYTTPLEYARFVLAVLGCAPQFTFRLDADLVQEMVAPQVRVNPSCAWGLGWGIDVSDPGDPVIWHWGDDGGYKNLVAASISSASGGVVMTNGDTGLFAAVPTLEAVVNRPLQGVREYLGDLYGTSLIRRCDPRDFADVLSVINDAARAFEGVIPTAHYSQPYMSGEELEGEIAAGVEFWAYEDESGLVGVMGMQEVQDVTLVRHAYTRPAAQRQGIGTTLLRRLMEKTERPVLVGTWAAAVWAIDFYEKNGFTLIPTTEQKNALLQKYWTVGESQRQSSVALANRGWWNQQG